MKILLELRPALDGHAGIPQETRLLFRGLSTLPGVRVDGLLQSSNLVLARGIPDPERPARGWPEDRRFDRQARVVVSLLGGDKIGPFKVLQRHAGNARTAIATLMSAAFGIPLPLWHFEPARFEDFLWRALFAKTLPHEDFGLVTSARYRIACVPWSAAHSIALLTRRFGRAAYPRMDTTGYDVMVAETPYPGRVKPSTQLVVRYHDAVPMLMPHTINDRAYHQASHYNALRRNVLDGAWFACVSEASRRDLVAIFPAAEPRAFTIPNTVSHRYFREEAPSTRAPEIVRMRANPTVLTQARVTHGRVARPEAKAELQFDGPYLLSVSTIEPRKNHLALLAAWERLRASGHPDLQLVLVGMLGWDSGPIVAKLLPWVARGIVHVLEDVPAAELRLLYRNARVTVCPSFGEGFGFSGVEAMQSGGIVAASALPVHREVYGAAASYFNPYSADDMARAISELLGDEAAARRAEMQGLGQETAERYSPERVLPQWQHFLDTIASTCKRPDDGRPPA